MHILLGFLIIVIGFLLAYKAHWLVQNFGSIAFAEKYLGMYGGTQLFLKLFGIVGVFVGALIMTGLLGGIFRSILGTFIPGVRLDS